MNKKLYPLYLCALALCAASASAQSTTTTTTTAAPAAPAAAAAPAAPAAAPTSPVSTPSMEGPLSVNVKPESFDTPLGKIYVSGAVTAIALADTPTFFGEKGGYADISNAQVFVQKVDGEFQFFLDAGSYSFPTVGVPYAYDGNTVSATYGALPVAFAKWVPNATFSLEAGKLPTLIGAEYAFTYENMNISRGLLWNQEPVVSRGVQANYTAGAFAFNASWNDGFYSDRYNWASGAATWTINSSNTLEFIIGGNLGTTDYGTSATPEVVNNDKQIYNLIYGYTAGQWTAQLYGQYAQSGNSAAIGVKDTSSTGVGVLVNYAVPNTSWNLSARIEQESTSGSQTDGSANLLYGPGSSAWSATFTPSYQNGPLFVRAEISWVGASGTTSGAAFGNSGTSTSQTRFAIETGILF